MQHDELIRYACIEGYAEGYADDFINTGIKINSVDIRYDE